MNTTKETIVKLIVGAVLIVIGIIASHIASERSDDFDTLFELIRDGLKKILVLYVPFSAIMLTLALIADVLHNISNFLNGIF